MNNFRTWVANHAVISSVLAEIAVLSLMNLIGLLLSGLLKLAGITISYEYVSFFLTEFPAALLSVGALLLVGHQYILKRRTTNFFAGLIPAGYFIVIGIYSAAVMLLNYGYTQLGEAMGVVYSADNLEAYQTALTEISSNPEQLIRVFQNIHIELNPWFEILAFLTTMLLVGITEEFLFRGVIAELLLKKFGGSKKGIWTATLLSGLLFGCAHLINLFAGGGFGVLIQVAVTCFMGMVLTAIYYRTGNIRVVVFVHAFIDFASLIVSGFFSGQAGVISTIASYSPIQLIGTIPYIIVLLVLLRPKKIVTIPDNMKLQISPKKQS